MKLNFRGLSTKEISVLLGISYDNAKKRLKRAEVKLKSMIEPEKMFYEK
jgi:DNA-directed RNA polymerase specialized sigma24 family protein